MNLHYRTKKKLAVAAKNQTPTFTDDAESHVLRFETYSKSTDWLLTDVDNALSGNPYFKKSN
jgi:hypothetical protein